MAEPNPHEVMAMEEKIARLKLKARGAASVNDYAQANQIEVEIAELMSQIAEMKKGTTDEEIPVRLEGINELRGYYFYMPQKPSETPSVKMSKKVGPFPSAELARLGAAAVYAATGTKDCKDCAGTKDCGCNDCGMTKDARAEVKRVSSGHENVSKRDVSYDLYIDGKYQATYPDVIAAIAARDKINKGTRDDNLERDLIEMKKTLADAQRRGQTAMANNLRQDIKELEVRIAEKRGKQTYRKDSRTVSINTPSRGIYIHLNR